jgi:NADPH-dependent 2,4-dienoyl-CoA reductase/sulfur reductase-like enzyme
MNIGQERGLLAQGKTLDRADIVIIGNGIAGLTAALEARRLAPDKRIVMITDQVHPTIHTPALKQFMVGKLNREQLLAYPAGTERAERIHVVTARVEELHARSKYITLTGGRGFGYDSLLLATGSAPVGLPEHLPGRDFDGVMTLHRLQDYLDLRRRLSEVYEAVVIGSGTHAIETVMGLVHYGVHVHWMIRGETILSRMLDKEASSLVMARVQRAGVSLHTNTQVLGIVGRIGCVAGVITSNRQMIPCQLVLSCTGTQAASKLAQRCTMPMEHDRGIKVDDQLRTSVPNIYAAGDVAALRDPITGVYEPRALWYAAVTQGRAVAAAMVGIGNQQSFGVPWHATHLGDLSMLTVGNPLLAVNDSRVTTLADSSGGSYRRMTLLGDRLLGYLSLGQTQLDSLAIKRIIDEGYPVGGITKALLKGTFDARSYLSQQQSRTVHSLLTSGRPPVQPTHVQPTHVQPTHVQAPNFPPAYAQPQPQQPVPNTQLPALTRLLPPTFQPAAGYGATANANVNDQYTDPLSPVQSEQPEQYPQQGSIRETGPIERLEEEEIAPFTGKLSHRSGVGRVIESELVPVVPVQVHRTPSGKLWSYAQEAQTQVMPQRDAYGYPNASRHARESDQERRRARNDYQQGSRGLWTYNEYE